MAGLESLLSRVRPRKTASGARPSASRPSAPRPPVQRPTAPRPLAVAGLAAPMELRESARTRRFTLKVDPGRGLIQVVVPVGVSEADVMGFIARHSEWVRARAGKLVPAAPFAHGAEVPILGVSHVIRHDPSHRGPAHAEGGVLTVGGGAEFVARRVRDYLIKRARDEITPRAHAKAARLGAKVAAVTLRDTRSRWGSCSSAGRLSFSWRLVMAPEPVLDYVVAHEVAHLKEMNHSARFWALVDRLVADPKRCRAWLKTNGARLFRYGG